MPNSDNTPVIRASFADYRTVKSRMVLQLIFEVPLESSKAVFDRLGFPMPDTENWVAIAMLNAGPHNATVDELPSSVPQESNGAAQGQRPATRSWYDMRPSQRAAILAGDQKFRQFLRNVYYASDVRCAEEATAWLKARCGIDSRKKLDEPDTEAADVFGEIEANFRRSAGLEAEDRS